jgi:hypothetical protein
LSRRSQGVGEVVSLVELVAVWVGDVVLEVGDEESVTCCDGVLVEDVAEDDVRVGVATLVPVGVVPGSVEVPSVGRSIVEALADGDSEGDSEGRWRRWWR